MARTIRTSRTLAWAITFLAIGLAGLADGATGSVAWFGPVYLLVICLAAWSLGWRAGIAAGLACVAVSIGVNGVQVYPLGGIAAVWNMAMRALAVGIIVALIASIRRSYEREWHRARIDPLTGALNKQAFFEKSSLSCGTNDWAILAYIDLDDFKQINDRYGHAAGDETLCAFAEGVGRLIRDTDIFARIGGDEFLLFVTVRDEAEGVSMARELHRRMSRIPNRLAVPIRCSAGVAVLRTGAAGLSEADVHRADQLMYQAKRERAGLRISTSAAAPNEIEAATSLAA